MSDATAMADPGPVIDQLLLQENLRIVSPSSSINLRQSSIWRVPSRSLPPSRDFNIWSVLDFTADDLVDIAQLVAEQSAFAEASGLDGANDPTVVSPVLYSTAQDALRQVFEKAQDCDFAE